MAGTIRAVSIPKIVSISVGEDPCPEGPGQVVIRSGFLRLVDTVVSDSTYIVLDKSIPAREAGLSGFIKCASETIALDEVEITLPSRPVRIRLGKKVAVNLDAVNRGYGERRSDVSISSEVGFRKMVAKRAAERLNPKGK